MRDLNAAIEATSHRGDAALARPGPTSSLPHGEQPSHTLQAAPGGHVCPHKERSRMFQDGREGASSSSGSALLFLTGH